MEASDPFTEGEGAIKICGLPTNVTDGAYLRAFFTVEQTPVNGYSELLLMNYIKDKGELHYLVVKEAYVDDVRNGVIPYGTLVNTVKLTYQP